MKHTFKVAMLAGLVAAATSSHATEIYKDEKNAVSIGGFVDARVIHTQGETEVVNGISRINFGFERQLTDGWSAFAKMEWGVDIIDGSDIIYNGRFESQQDDFFYNRLGYAGIKHDKYGSLALGKQWSAWYDVVGGTNYGFVWDGNASGTYTYNKDDGGVNGTGRGDKTVQYRNSIGDFSFTLQAQLQDDNFDFNGEDGLTSAPLLGTIASADYGDTYGFSLTYTALKDLNISVGYNTGEFDATRTDGSTFSERDYIYGLGVTWGNWDKEGLYVAGNINENEFHDTDNLGRMIPESYGIETLVSYRFDNNIRVFASYNMLDAGDEYEDMYNGDEFQRQFAVMGVHYIWIEDVVLYLEGRADFGNFDGEYKDAMSESEDDGIAVGIRYNL